MSLDIILWAPSKAALAAWAASNPPANPLWQDGEAREGVGYTWWAGSGQFMTAPGVYDGDGIEITPPTFAPGVVALLRLHSSFFSGDVEGDGSRWDYSDPANPVAKDQSEYSKAAKWIKNNGTPGTMAGINYWEVGGVRLLKPADVEAFCEANNVPGHIWVGGNTY